VSQTLWDRFAPPPPHASELAAANYRGQALADDLRQTIEVLAAETIVGDLDQLPAGSSSPVHLISVGQVGPGGGRSA
jgi:hypothetical protein